MPFSHNTWQVRECGSPLIDIRHSKQIPIPHNGPRRSPVTELRQNLPAIMTAAATVVPGATLKGTPSMVIVSRSGMDMLFSHSRRQVRLGGNLGLPTYDLVHKQASGTERGGDPETLMPRSQKQSLVLWPGPN